MVCCQLSKGKQKISLCNKDKNMLPYKRGIIANLIKIIVTKALSILSISTDNATGLLILQRTHFHSLTFKNFLRVITLPTAHFIIISNAIPKGFARYLHKETPKNTSHLLFYKRNKWWDTANLNMLHFRWWHCILSLSISNWKQSYENYVSFKGAIHFEFSLFVFCCLRHRTYRFCPQSHTR